jgi:hypothetical protein
MIFDQGDGAWIDTCVVERMYEFTESRDAGGRKMPAQHMQVDLLLDKNERFLVEYSKTEIEQTWRRQAG